jgi:hypothetical protein
MADFACNNIHFRHNDNARTSAEAAAAAAVDAHTSNNSDARESMYVQLLIDMITASAHLAAAWQVLLQHTEHLILQYSYYFEVISGHTCLSMLISSECDS